MMLVLSVPVLATDLPIHIEAIGRSRLLEQPASTRDIRLFFTLESEEITEAIQIRRGEQRLLAVNQLFDDVENEVVDDELRVMEAAQAMGLFAEDSRHRQIGEGAVEEFVIWDYAVWFFIVCAGIGFLAAVVSIRRRSKKDA